MTPEEQRAKEEEVIIAERRTNTDRRKSGDIDYELLNLDMPDRRKVKDRRVG